MMLIQVNFSNQWPEILDQKHRIWKSNKARSQIKLDVDGLTWKKNFKYTKGSITKNDMIKIKIQNEFYFLLNGEIKIKNWLNNMTKKIKEWGSKLKLVIKIIFWLNGEIEKKNQFNKKTKKKKKDGIEKHNIWQIEIEGWNWKYIKLLQKCQEQKLKIKRIRTEIEIPTIKRVIL